MKEYAVVDHLHKSNILGTSCVAHVMSLNAHLVGLKLVLLLYIN